MIKYLLFYAALNCPVPEVINNRDNILTRADVRQISVSSMRCSVLFKDAPCLIKFFIEKDMHYNVICGALVSKGV